MENQPILSICIPTYKREYLIEKLINGIYAQNCDRSLFEVCITDNSETDETQKLIQNKFSGIENLHYKKVECEGYRNSIEALKLGNGQFLKLHNDYTMFHDGCLAKLIDNVAALAKDKPVVFYTLRGKDEVRSFRDFDKFMYDINYLSTWSTSFSIWKEDFDRLMTDGINCNSMYPHTSLLFAESWKNNFLVDEYGYFYNDQPKKKGGIKGKSGYNLVDNFVRIYLGMVNDDLVSKNLISPKTYARIETNILRFCANSYVRYNNRPGYTYSFDDKKGIITKQCGTRAYMQYCFFELLYRIRKLVKPGDIS